MSVPVDDDPGEESERARDVLASWLDDYSDGRCEVDDLREAFVDICRSDPEASWDALALLDQYQRRGRLQSSDAQVLKTDVEQIAFRSAGESATPRRKPPTEPAPRPRELAREAVRDAKPMRSAQREAPLAEPVALRKLTPERLAESTRPGTAFIDRTRLREEITPEPRAERRRAPVVRPEAPSAHSAAQASEVLRDRYELLSVLDRDASGVLYCALDRRRSHLSVAARYVAVKVLSANYAGDPHALTELQREFHQAQGLSHPNIISVFDLDRDGDRHFVVMELLQGALLSDVLQGLGGEPMRRAHALTIISGVGAALVHAHGREIVHGDLKPANVMITETGEVRVLEFGFARRQAFELHSASLSEETSAPAPAYASAERLNGSEPEASDDVYSLACIAYELLAGRHPFEGRSALVARARGRRPPRISGLERRQQQALQRALLWTRGERRISAAELIAALGGNPAGGGLVTPDEILEPQTHSPRWVGPAAFAAMVAAVSAAVIYIAPRLAIEDSKVVQTAAPPPAAVPTDTQAPSPASPAPTNEPQASAATRPPADSAAGAADASTSRSRSADTPPAQAAVRPQAPRPAIASAGRPAISFDQDSYVVQEGAGTARVQVVRTGPADEAVTFTWTLRPNSAQSGEDFAAIGPAVERIPAQVRRATLTFPLVSDALVEPTEVFLVELATDSDQVALGERAQATVIVVDDD